MTYDMDYHDPDALPTLKLDELERTAVRQALDRHGGNREAAAAELGISMRTLQRRLRHWAKVDEWASVR